ETHVRESKQCITGPHRFNADLSRSHKSMSRNNLLDDRHRTWSSFDWRRRHLAGESRFVVVEQAAVRDDVLRYLIETLGELGKRDVFAVTNAFDQAEISCRQETDVLRVLTVDLLDALRDHELDTRGFLGVRRSFA